MAEVKVIMRGKESEVAKIIRENSLRAKRGDVSFEYQTNPNSKNIDMDDSKDIDMEGKRKYTKKQVKDEME